MVCCCSDVCIQACSERKKQILFRIFSVITLFVSVYTVCLKKIRGDDKFFYAALVIYFVSGLVGGLYSIYLRGVLSLAEEEDAEGESETELTGTIRRGIGEDEYLELSEVGEAEVPSEDGSIKETEPVDIEVKNLGDDHTKNDSRARFADDPGPSVRVGARFADVEKGNSLPKVRPQISTEGTCVFKDNGQSKKKWADFQRLKKIMRKSMEESSRAMKISHLLCLPKWYHFCFSGYTLKKHLREIPLKQEVIDQLDEYNVKKVSYNRNWQRYCEVELAAKEVSLVISTLQTVPLVILDIYYWSEKRLGLDWYGPEKINSIELASTILAMIIVSYRIIACANQDRKLDHRKQDLKFLHLVYLTVCFFLFALPRALSIALVMCVSEDCVYMVIIVLFIQFITMVLSWDSISTNNNLLNRIISALLMLFVYSPLENAGLSRNAHHSIMILEMICMFLFGFHSIGQVQDDPSFMGTSVDTTRYLYFAGGILVSYFMAILVSAPFVETFLTRRVYRKMLTNKEINDYIRAVNNHFEVELVSLVPEAQDGLAKASSTRSLYIKYY